MAYRDYPDMRVPTSDIRCEAMTKPVSDTYQTWRKASHRCVRRATQARAGRIVCNTHAAMPKIDYWNGEPDTFKHLPFKHLERKEASH